MLKKAGYIILSVFLITVISGITVNMHYCGDHLYSFNINGKTAGCCDNDNCGGCKDKSVKLEIQDEFLPVLHDGLISGLIPLQMAKHTTGDLNLLHDQEITVNGIYISNNSPPGIQARLSLLQTYLL